MLRYSPVTPVISHAGREKRRAARKAQLTGTMVDPPNVLPWNREILWPRASRLVTSCGATGLRTRRPGVRISPGAPLKSTVYTPLRGYDTPKRWSLPGHSVWQAAHAGSRSIDASPMDRMQLTGLYVARAAVRPARNIADLPALAA
jgi:hypothetical protein